MRSLVYCFLDIETDGPQFPQSSMLGFACVAYDEDGIAIGTFGRNLVPLPGTAPDPHTLAWWRTQPEAWAHITSHQRPASEAMLEYVSWLQGLDGEPVLAAHPLMFDGIWIDGYLQKFTELRAFGDRGTSPFVGAGIDIPSYVQAALGLPYFRTRPSYSAELLGSFVHSHKPIDDAHGHAALYFNARQIRRKLP